MGKRTEVTILAGSIRQHESIRHQIPSSPDHKSFRHTTNFVLNNLCCINDAPPCIPALCNAMGRTRLLTPHEQSYFTAEKLYPIAQLIWPQENIKTTYPTSSKTYTSQTYSPTDWPYLGHFSFPLPAENVMKNGLPRTHQLSAILWAKPHKIWCGKTQSHQETKPLLGRSS